jgi:hypothetical protein
MSPVAWLPLLALLAWRMWKGLTAVGGAARALAAASRPAARGKFFIMGSP